MDDLFDFFEDENEAPILTSSISKSKPSLKTQNYQEPILKKPKTIETPSIIVTDQMEQSVTVAFKPASFLQDEPNKPLDDSLNLIHRVRHQVAVPPTYNYTPINQHKRPENPARTYPFTLDPFQELSISCIERNESVLVSAHTSAGKTVVAEYAIALSLREKQRVIYTSPIKVNSFGLISIDLALSNQKYRELSQEFGDVGLMTGDVTINPSASCLVMTTEILRSMLYRGSEVMREVAWVIFDEIHYMRDRGVVWEEAIILLPDKVHFVFLSATIPNAFQFAQWICKIHNQPTHVVYTDFRPTPLQHYLFPAGGDGIHLVVDEKSVFREDNFQKAISGLQEMNADNQITKKNKKDKSSAGPSDLFKIVRMIMMKNYHPVIVFSFSKKECENNALQLSKLDFNDDAEKDLVQSVFDNAIHSLNEEDRVLPQIQLIIPLLKRGIGIHHSGLLPILKEVIEILFQEGLLKILFATETFSIGLNMPAKTVVFTSVRKWDGKNFRWLGGGEYIQMSGRAGRRGLDDRGIVILMIDEKMEPAVAKSMLKGEADRLDSAFHLTYSMILNLIRVEGISPEYMLEKCFLQFQSMDKVPQLESDVEILEKRKTEFIVEREEELSEYHDIKIQLDTYMEDIRSVITHPTYCLPFLQPGRLVKVQIQPIKENETPLDFGWGVIFNFSKRTTLSKGKDISAPPDSPTYIVDILLNCLPGSDSSKNPQPCPKSIIKGDMLVVPCLLSSIQQFSSVRVFIPKEIKSIESRTQMLKSLQEVQRRFKGDIPLLSPIDDMGIKDPSFTKLVNKIDILKSTLKKSVLNELSETRLDELYSNFLLKQSLIVKIKGIRKEIQQAHSVIQLDELKYRRRILRRLGYINQSDVIEMKGRVACEISAADELLLTEMIFQGSFNELLPEQVVSLLSCFTWQEKAKEETVKVRENLAEPFKLLKEIASRIAKVSQESKLEINEKEYLESFRPELIDVVYSWCQGAKFAEIMKMTDVFEGSIIRCMRNLEELLRQMSSASKVIGNDALEAKFAEGITQIKRDIVFAASLYL